MKTDVAGLLGGTDIYLVDQIMKGRYEAGDVVLDAGCGNGRNLHWFRQQPIEIYAVDVNSSAIASLQQNIGTVQSDRFRVEPVEALSFEADFFDAVICSAVLHFARDTAHFFAMVNEIHRVLKPGGSLFIRMATDIGIEDRVQLVGDGVYAIPDGSTRFLLTRSLLQQVMERYAFLFLEDFKTVNVNDVRCMSTLVLQKTF